VLPFPGWLAELGRRASPRRTGTRPPAPRTRPDIALVNYYDEQAKMGLHQDKDESSRDPVVSSLSLGTPAWFRFRQHRAPQPAVGRRELCSGDLFVFGGAVRLGLPRRAAHPAGHRRPGHRAARRPAEHHPCGSPGSAPAEPGAALAITASNDGYFEHVFEFELLGAPTPAGHRPLRGATEAPNGGRSGCCCEEFCRHNPAFRPHGGRRVDLTGRAKGFLLDWGAQWPGRLAGVVHFEVHFSGRSGGHRSGGTSSACPVNALLRGGAPSASAGPVWDPKRRS